MSNQDDSRTLPILADATVRTTRDVFSIRNVYKAVGDDYDSLLDGLSFSSEDACDPRLGKSTTLLALLTVFQFAENLADRPACAALTRRMDWRYALRLPDHGLALEPGLLCSFRQLLIGYPKRFYQFQCLLDRCAAAGLLSRGKRDVQAVKVVEFVCRLNQLERVHEALADAIGALASHQPETLRALAQPHWYHRYQGRACREFESISDGELEVCALALGADARHLLESISATGEPALVNLSEVSHLSAILKQQYQWQGETLVWRQMSCKLCPWLADGISLFCSKY